jgi:hypothetical protein
MSEITEKGELFLGLQEFKKSGHKFIPADTSLSGLYGTDFPTFLNDEGFSSSDLKTCSSWLDYLLPFLNLSDNGTPFVTFIGEAHIGDRAWLVEDSGFFIYRNGISTAYESKKISLELEYGSEEMKNFDNIELLAEHFANSLKMDFAYPG